MILSQIEGELRNKVEPPNKGHAGPVSHAFCPV